jgi:hypothetical protein
MDPILYLTIAGVVIAAVPVGVALHGRWKDRRPPEVSMEVDVSLNRTVFPTDRYARGWSRDARLRYTVVRIKNKRTRPITIAGVFATFPGVSFTACLAATNDLRELVPEESTYVYFETTKYGGPKPRTLNLRWIGGEHTYGNPPRLEGWRE